jgi:p21-activated kinase 1
MAQAIPPFADVQDPRQIGTRLPRLSQPEIWSRSFHDFMFGTGVDTTVLW